jgi:hypothetical protein
MGNSAQDHRIAIGLYAGRMSCSSWSPRTGAYNVSSSEPSLDPNIPRISGVLLLLVALGFFAFTWKLIVEPISPQKYCQELRFCCGTQTESAEFVVVERTAGEVRMLLLLSGVEINPGPPERRIISTTADPELSSSLSSLTSSSSVPSVAVSGILFGLHVKTMTVDQSDLPTTDTSKVLIPEAVFMPGAERTEQKESGLGGVGGHGMRERSEEIHTPEKRFGDNNCTEKPVTLFSETGCSSQDPSATIATFGAVTREITESNQHMFVLGDQKPLGQPGQSVSSSSRQSGRPHQAGGMPPSQSPSSGHEYPPGHSCSSKPPPPGHSKPPGHHSSKNAPSPGYRPGQPKHGENLTLAPVDPHLGSHTISQSKDGSSCWQPMSEEKMRAGKEQRYREMKEHSKGRDNSWSSDGMSFSFQSKSPSHQLKMLISNSKLDLRSESSSCPMPAMDPSVALKLNSPLPSMVESSIGSPVLDRVGKTLASGFRGVGGRSDSSSGSSAALLRSRSSLNVTNDLQSDKINLDLEEKVTCMHRNLSTFHLSIYRWP